MNIINFILQVLKGNWLDVLVVLFFVAFIVLLWKKGKQQAVKSMIYYLVCKAEQQFGSKTGDIKYAAVVTWLYDRLPIIVQWVFTKEEIGNYIEEAVDRLKKYLQENPDATLLSYSDEQFFTKQDTYLELSEREE